MYVVTGETDAFAYESITVGTTAVGFTTATFMPGSAFAAKLARVTVESAVDGSTPTMRYRYDGTDPTTSEGHLANIEDVMTIYNINNLRTFRAIRTGAISVVMKVTYER